MTPALRAKLIAAMPGLKERAEHLVELFETSRYVWTTRPLALDEAARALLTPQAIDFLVAIIPRLHAIEDWSAAANETICALFRRARP